LLHLQQPDEPRVLVFVDRDDIDNAAARPSYTLTAALGAGLAIAAC
jgi:hypothetical protein